jgi:hypothetical protein
MKMRILLLAILAGFIGCEGGSCSGCGEPEGTDKAPAAEQKADEAKGADKPAAPKAEEAKAAEPAKAATDRPQAARPTPAAQPAVSPTGTAPPAPVVLPPNAEAARVEAQKLLQANSPEFDQLMADFQVDESVKAGQAAGGQNINRGTKLLENMLRAELGEQGAVAMQDQHRPMMVELQSAFLASQQVKADSGPILEAIAKVRAQGGGDSGSIPAVVLFQEAAKAAGLEGEAAAGYVAAAVEMQQQLQKLHELQGMK